MRDKPDILNSTSAADPATDEVRALLAPFFDADWYLSQNPDVATADFDPLTHYIRHGAWEGRDPLPMFDSDWYLSRYKDVAATGMNPLLHYVRHGASEGRDPHPLFDSTWYLSKHAADPEAVQNPLAHYLKHGAAELLPTSECIVTTIRGLQSNETAWPPDVMPTAEAGIIISACGRLFQPLYANLRTIRESGCNLPVEVWHLPGEFTRDQIEVLGGMANFVEAGETPFNDLSGQHTVHGFKAWMLSQSRFRKTLMLDVDSMPLRNPELIFECGETCILWKNGPWKYSIEKIAQLRRDLEISVHPFEFESGQLFVDKGNAGVRKALRFAAALNTLGWRLYGHVYGDKETYPLAFDLLGEKYRIAPDSGIHPAGDPGQAEAMLQPWLDGAPLFFHPLVKRKECWWKYKPEWTALKEEAVRVETSLYRVGIVGLGVVGGAMVRGFKAAGCDVCGHDIDPARVRDDIERTLLQDVVLLSVPTPTDAEGHCDLSAIHAVLERAAALDAQGLFVVRSTVPVGTTDTLISKYPSLKIGVSPEFLRKQSADADFRHPQLIVYGGAGHETYFEFMKRACEIPAQGTFVLSTREAEFVKLLLNSFAALKTVFASELAIFARSMGVDWSKVTAAAQVEGRLGAGYFSGTGPDNLPGFGGSCLPKDCLMLVQQLGAGSLLEQAVRNNEKLRSMPGSK